MKSGFVSILGRPNAGKSTLLNALTGEKLAIVTHKSQTTRHRIRTFLNAPGYQIVLSDTPGIIDPEYKLHEKMMQVVKSALEDADLALLLVDARRDPKEADVIFSALKLKVPAIVVINKSDAVTETALQDLHAFFKSRPYALDVISISALRQENTDGLLQLMLKHLPEGEPFFPDDDLTDMPTRFFIGEIIREKLFLLLEDELPYQSTVQVRTYEEKQTLVKISADIIVQRESQKAIVVGEGGRMIRQLGTEARKDIEAFIGQKVFLELFVKVRQGWRDNDLFLKEFGYP